MHLNKKQLIYLAKLEKSRRELWYYCKTLYPGFYKENRLYLRTLCDNLQEFYYNDDEFMVINAPP